MLFQFGNSAYEYTVDMCLIVVHCLETELFYSQHKHNEVMNISFDWPECPSLFAEEQNSRIAEPILNI